MISIPHVEFHVTHDCNFQCEHCGHFNQHKFRGTHISLEELESWFKKWHKRISPKSMSILGGEPFLRGANQSLNRAGFFIHTFQKYVT